MVVLGFLALFCFAFTFLSSEGAIRPPSGTDLMLLPHKLNNEIKWTFDGKAYQRVWLFTRRGDTARKTIATISVAGDITIFNKSLPGVSVISPATLVLKKVDKDFNGKYEFRLTLDDGSVIVSYVNVFIAEKPTVKLNCSNTTTLNEGDDFSCLCEGKDGNPPANVTWFKDDTKIGGTGKKEQMLTLKNVDNTDRGTYKCLAESHPDERYEDKKTVKIIVHFRPHVTTITFMPKKAKVGKAMNITCESEGLPEPSFIITHNNTEVIAEKTYNIPQVKWSDSGLYQCIAKNILGSNSKCYFFIVSGETTSSTKVDCDVGDNVVVWHIVVSLILGIVIGCLLSYIVSCSRRKFKIKKSQRSIPEHSTSQGNTTYQELDLTKMNTEGNNYQSLKGNTTRIPRNEDVHDDNSTYTQLSKTKEVENNYQSLT